MRAIKKVIKSIFSWIALSLFFLLTLAWFFFFANDPRVTSNWKNIFWPVIEFISLRKKSLKYIINAVKIGQRQ